MKRATFEVTSRIAFSAYFNPRPREEGDAAANISRHSAAISIHALVKRATADRFKPKSPANDFNPRPREEGDREEMEPKLADIISIHALVKRATGWITEALRGVSISIHALVKRATCFKL